MNLIHRLNPNICAISPKVTPILTNEIKRNLCNQLQISKRTLNRYIQHNRYPLRLIRTLTDITGEDYTPLIEKYHSKWKYISLPTVMNKELAYVFGYLQGDGSVESNGRRVNFSDEYLEQMVKINLLIKKLFGVEGKITSKISPPGKKESYTLTVGSIILNSFFSDVLGMKRGVKDSLTIPLDIVNCTEHLSCYLSGIYDADGTLPKEPWKCKQMFIDVTLKNKDIILDIQSSLSKLGIRTLKPYCRIAISPNSDTISKTWELRIRKRDDMIRFLNEVGFQHSDKALRAVRLAKYMDQ